MSALSFREQAAIALFASCQTAEQKYAAVATSGAQRLADACCEAWGHANVTDAEGRPVRCARCGFRFGS